MTSFESQLSLNLNKWFQYTKKNSFKKAISLTVDSISICKKTILESDCGIESKYRNSAAIGGVFFKGLNEFTYLYRITRSKNWHNHNKSVSRSWYLLQNCNERFNYVFKFIEIDEEISKFILELLQTTDQIIRRYYGPGVYSSPEILLKSVECNICHSDFRRCSHTVNKIYDGIICKMVVTEFECTGSALVESPEDLRCRIWPWQLVEEDGGGLLIKDTPMVISFDIQDFLE